MLNFDFIYNRLCKIQIYPANKTWLYYIDLKFRYALLFLKLGLEAQVGSERQPKMSAPKNCVTQTNLTLTCLD